jgi:hypothetical protein
MPERPLSILLDIRNPRVKEQMEEIISSVQEFSADIPVLVK